VDRSLVLYSYAYIGVIQFVSCFFIFVYFCPGIWDLIKEWKRPEDLTSAERDAYLEGTTTYYWSLVWGQIGAAICTTTVEESLFVYGFFRNKVLTVFQLVMEIGLGLLLVYWEPVAGPMGMRPLPMDLLLLPVLVAFLPILVTGRKLVISPALVVFIKA